MSMARSVLLSGVVLVFCSAAAALAQDEPSPQSSETVAKPKKKDASAPDDTQQQPIPSKFTHKEGQPQSEATFKSEATTVTVDVAVLDNKGHFIPGIPQGNFRVVEDGVPQQISSFGLTDAPMTVCLLIEFSNLFQQFWSEGWYQTLVAAFGFVQTLKPDDYVAVIAYDLKPEILSDFSTNRQKTQEALNRLQIAGFSESNLYDALVDTETRMENIEGRKAIVLISSGIDTFSKLTFDKARKAIQSAGVPVYAIGLLQAMREYMDAQNMLGSIARLDFLQADNQMTTFARETGGQSFFPMFYGEFPNIFHAVNEALRHQYTIGYHPTNQARDGGFRKLKVELVNPATGEPLRVVDQKNKPIKYQVIAKAGYKAAREVE